MELSKSAVSRSSSHRKRANLDRFGCCFTFGKFPCCCLTRRFLAISQIIYDLTNSIYFIMTYTLFLMTPHEQLRDALSTFFRYFNPLGNLGYLNQDLDKEQQ